MQTLKPVTTLSADVSPEQALEVSERDGAVIIKNLFSREMLGRFLVELKPYTDARAAGSGYADAAALVTLGQKTRRITGLAARSVTAGEVITHPLILAWAKGLLSGGDHGDIQLSTSTYIEIWPGEKAQPIHADEGDYPEFLWGKDMPNITCNAIIALDDFTDENGATRCIPGSHKLGSDWARFDEQPASIPAEMTAGSALFTTGKVLHGGGANRSTASRRGLAIQFAAGWLRPMAAHQLETSRERAKTMSPELKELLGFTSYKRPLIEGRAPRALLNLFDMGEASNYLERGPLA
ncbi:phytanoyl-CoA dioxygenase PhyH [Paraburkholderia sp. BL27I4N3]|uniref:phytanoyl-CoA dioxygenase family protein n=1 Tax=Paraburkholderia sp. BL27I4N3 TaxID=1938805 RepID=UPI000E273246|nr:phytanoyl-CoA dioxygenase family protein [Paraburkholderia sp. BL27I4N3]REE07508.1 phytanoyl-CoA dioxygenase PhyH [Paraburkholderia sp. BL27I4N3]